VEATEETVIGISNTTLIELRSELDQLEARISELSRARELITFDLADALKERDRLQHHLGAAALSVMERGETWESGMIYAVHARS
jgi:hypothetical protein